MPSPAKPANPNQFTQPVHFGDSPWTVRGGAGQGMYGQGGGQQGNPYAQQQPSGMAPFNGIGNGVTAAANPMAYGGSTMGGMFGPTANVSGSYNLPQSSYLPFPNQAQNQALTNNQVSTLFANSDLRNLAKQYGMAPGSGVSTDYRHSPGAMASLLGPRADAAGQAANAMATNPYSFANANFNSLLGLQGQQGSEAFNLGQMAQNLYQGGQSSQMGDLSSMLGLFNQMFGGLTGAAGGLMNDVTGGMGDMFGGGDLSSLLGGATLPSAGTPPRFSAPVKGGFNNFPGFVGGF